MCTDSISDELWILFNVLNFSIIYFEISYHSKFNSKMCEKSAGFGTDNLRYQKLITLENTKLSRSTAFIEKSG